MTNPSTPIEEVIERLASAIKEAMRDQLDSLHTFLPAEGWNVIIDGRLDIVPLAKAALDSLNTLGGKGK